MDVAAGAEFVEAIKPAARATARPGVVGVFGGFASLFDLAACGYKDPVLLAATDGVGTKLLVANAAGRHQTVGVDLVAMCVNDLVVQGAEPLFFLDYYATGRLDRAVAEAVIAGIAAGCRQANCALIGGETAEMPGMYADGTYDLAGFTVGVVERGENLDGEGVVAGDVVLGLAASGLHSNGFSLVRHIVADRALDYHHPAPFDGQLSLGEALLTPTRIYVKSCLAAARSGMVKAFAHITGGGLIENLPRVLPPETGAEIDANAWPLPPVFSWLASTVGTNDLAQTFNCGIGMAVVVAPDDTRKTVELLTNHGETAMEIGRVTERRDGVPRVVIQGAEAAWKN